MAIKTTILPELHAFIQSLPDDAAYSDLPRLVREGGWLWRLRQTDAVYHPGRVMLTFDLLVGKEPAALEVLDQVTVQVPEGVAQVSLAGRNMLAETLVYLVTGRLPPVNQPAPAPAPAPTHAPVHDAPRQNVEMNDHDIEWQSEPMTDKLPSIISGRTIDGVPLLDDLYAIEDDPALILRAVFNTIEEYLPQVDSIEKLKAFWSKNEREFAFVQDFGTAEDKSRLPQLFAKRRTILTEAGPSDAQAPRRRVPRSAA